MSFTNEMPPDACFQLHHRFRLIHDGVCLDIEYLAQNVRKEIGDITFDEAYKRTNRVLNITVSSITANRSQRRLLNHITAPNTLIWSATAASCAAPGLFKPVSLKTKNSVWR